MKQTVHHGESTRGHGARVNPSLSSSPSAGFCCFFFCGFRGLWFRPNARVCTLGHSPNDFHVTQHHTILEARNLHHGFLQDVVDPKEEEHTKC